MTRTTVHVSAIFFSSSAILADAPAPPFLPPASLPYISLTYLVKALRALVLFSLDRCQFL